MAIKTRDLTRDWRRGDAERLARLFRDASEGWPGGAWDPETPEEVERRVRETPLLGAFVSDEGDHFASFCSLYAKPNEKHRAYVPLLTALPSYHGQGYGKAVLHRSVERVYELGIARVDLHTWPGNLKAVPLYKKSGFMWAPDEPWGVLMQNFTTGARRHPAAQTYFRQHDWYQTLQRDLALVPDEHRRGKVRVYPYLWEEDGDRLRLVYDRQSWGLLELETNEFLVSCSLEDEKLIAGLPQRVRWQIVNYTGKPLEVALLARADEGIALDYKEFLQVRTKAELGAEFTISPELREKEREPEAPVVHTELLINGTPISLAAGFQVRQPVSFSLDSQATGLRAGRPEQVTLQVWNDLDKPVEAAVRLSASSGVTLGVTEAPVRLPAKGSAELPLPLTAAEAGLVEVKAEAEVTYGASTLTPKPATLSAHALAVGEVVGHVEKKQVVLESASLRVTFHRKGGYCQVFDRVRNRSLAQVRNPLFGPPLAWDEFFDRPCEARLERRGDRLTAVLTTDSIHRPGLRLERRLTLSNLPVLEVTDTLLNGTPAPLKGRLQNGLSAHLGEGWLAAMTRRGLVRGPHLTTGRQFPEHNLSEKPEDWPEGWLAIENREGEVVGALWEGAERILWEGWGLAFERPVPAIAPGQSLTLPPTYVYAGDGGALTVRRWWQMLYGERAQAEQHLPPTRQPLEFGLEPRPLVMHGEQAEAKLVVDSVGRLELAGTLTATAPEGLRLHPAAVSFDQVCEENCVREAATVQKKRGLAEGAYFVETELRLDRAIYRERQPVLVLGDPKQQVSVKKIGEQGELLRIENGVLALTVAPDFCGSAISLERGKEQLFRSAYPEARPLAWENPWFGGITPQLGSLGRDLTKEKFTARPLARRGSQGVTWKGVRVTCLPKEERAKHDKLEVDYLLAPGSSVLAVALRTTRRTDTAGWLNASLTFWPLLGGSFLDAVLTTSEEARTQLLRTDFGRGASALRWVIAEHPEQEQAVVLTNGADHARVFANVFGRDGYFLGGRAGGRHEARETREAVFFLSYPSPNQARDLAEVLSRLPALP